MSTRFGAWVARARLQARLGSPIPTKTTSPSRSSRAATEAIISAGVWSEPIVHSGTHPGLRPQPLEPTGARDVLRPVAHAVHELIEVRAQPDRIARDRLP